MPGMLAVRGIPDVPTVNFRSGPGLQFAVVLQADVGTSGLPILDVQADRRGDSIQGKTYQWIKTSFPGDTVCWVRDDLVEIWGNLSAFGYGIVSTRTLAFSLTRGLREDGTATDPTTETDDAPENDPAITDAVVNDLVVRGIEGDGCFASIAGIPSLPFVNVRSGPGTSFEKLFEAPKGGSLRVIDAEPDKNSSSQNGKIFQWLHLSFPDGETGWVRDDLVTVSGNCVAHGFGTLSQPTLAFNINRNVGDPIDRDRPTHTDTHPASGCVGEVITSIPARIRSDALIATQELGRVPTGEHVHITGKKPQLDGGAFNWLHVEYEGIIGFMREDLVTISGDCVEVDVVPTATDLFPLPVIQSRLTNGFEGFAGHWGWDLGVNEMPVFSGSSAGIVVRAQRCTKCTDERPSIYINGVRTVELDIVFGSAEWGWGYGNHIIVRYDHDNLPPSAKVYLASKGMEGFNMFVNYAHLKTMLVDMNFQLLPGTQIGISGNTGNSDGPHLHLEVRASRNTVVANNWTSNQFVLTDPKFLFRFPTSG